MKEGRYEILLVRGDPLNPESRICCFEERYEIEAELKTDTEEVLDSRHISAVLLDLTWNLEVALLAHRRSRKHHVVN